MRNAHLFRVAIASLLLSTLGAVMSSAQTFQTLVDFNLTDGENPSYSSPIVRAANGNVYGTTLHGGAQGGGTVFQVTPSGAFNTLFSFCVTAACSGAPNGVIVGSDGNLYGTTQAGGANGRGIGGTVFRLAPSSGTLTTLYNFCSLASCADGSYPQASPVQGSDGNFYGTTGQGGTSNYNAGTVYRLMPSGGLTTLHSFCSLSSCSEGYFPTVMLQGSDGDFYGITLYGGNDDQGTVFKITPAGVLTTLYSFCSLANCADGAGPSTLIEGSDGNFYGTTLYTGLLNRSGGTVFQLTPSGTLTTLYSFCALANCADGSSPNVLVQGSDGNFYGTTSSGGANRRSDCSSTGCGTFFHLTRGGALTTLYNFCSAWGGCTDGESPAGVVQTSGNKFLGTTFLGGSGSCPDCGTIWNWSPNVAVAPTFTPSSLSFGDQAVNTTSAPKSVTVKNVNTGSATLHFSNFSVNPPFAISSNTCGATLAVGKTCMVKVTFTPTVVGKVNGALNVADNAPESPQTVPLTGTGIAQATVMPTSLTFGTVKVGKTSGYKNVTLKNNLPTTLTGISYATTGPFAVAGSTCSTTLASEHSCTISVTFSPTTIGPASGMLNVTDSANNSPQAVSLSGTGD